MAGDVWAFGVVIWEVMTRGMNPYPNLQVCILYIYSPIPIPFGIGITDLKKRFEIGCPISRLQQAYVLFEFLKAGKRMGKPDFCPDIL